MADPAVLTPAPADTGEAKGPQGPRIRCPLCGFTPQPADEWACLCTHSWHTFDTGGVCPACLRQWKSTQCPACKGWSAHSGWYEYSG